MRGKSRFFRPARGFAPLFFVETGVKMRGMFHARRLFDSLRREIGESVENCGNYRGKNPRFSPAGRRGRKTARRGKRMPVPTAFQPVFDRFHTTVIHRRDTPAAPPFPPPKRPRRGKFSDPSLFFGKRKGSQKKPCRPVIYPPVQRRRSLSLPAVGQLLPAEQFCTRL